MLRKKVSVEFKLSFLKIDFQGMHRSHNTKAMHLSLCHLKFHILLPHLKIKFKKKQFYY